MKNLAIVLVAALLCIASLPAPLDFAYASDTLITAADYNDDYDYDDDEDYDDEDEMNYLSAKDLSTVDVDLAYGSCNSLPLWFYCDALKKHANTNYYDEKIKVEVFLKKSNGKYKAVAQGKMNDWRYYDGHSSGVGSYFGSDLAKEKPSLSYDFKIKNLKPYKKYTVKVVCTTTKSKLKKTITRSFRTAHKPIEKTAVNRIGSSYKWSKAKGAKGYVVHSRKFVYQGKNQYGVNVYRWKYTAKFTKNTTATLSAGSELIKVIPYSKHSGNYYLNMVELLKSKAKVLKSFKATSIAYYR